MRYKPLPIGIDNFKKLIENNYSVISRYGIAFCGKECMVKLVECHNPVT